MADPGQADALNKQSLDLASEGRPEDALAGIAEAIALYRQLVAAEPESYRDDYEKAVELLHRVRVS